MDTKSLYQEIKKIIKIMVCLFGIIILTWILSVYYLFNYSNDEIVQTQAPFISQPVKPIHIIKSFPENDL